MPTQFYFCHPHPHRFRAQTNTYSFQLFRYIRQTFWHTWTPALGFSSQPVRRVTQSSWAHQIQIQGPGVSLRQFVYHKQTHILFFFFGTPDKINRCTDKEKSCFILGGITAFPSFCFLVAKREHVIHWMFVCFQSPNVCCLFVFWGVLVAFRSVCDV